MTEEIYQCKKLFGDDVWRTKQGIAREMDKRPGLIMIDHKPFDPHTPTINYTFIKTIIIKNRGSLQ